MKQYYLKNPKVLEVYDAAFAKWNSWVKIIVLIAPTLIIGIVTGLFSLGIWGKITILIAIALQLSILIFLSDKLAEFIASRIVAKAVRDDPSIVENWDDYPI